MGHHLERMHYVRSSTRAAFDTKREDAAVTSFEVLLRCLMRNVVLETCTAQF